MENSPQLTLESQSPELWTVSDEPTKTRVCDRCIRKKVKCDMKRPTCSRCNESARDCVYSIPKKRPGPARGFRRRVVARPVGCRLSQSVEAGSPRQSVQSPSRAARRCSKPTTEMESAFIDIIPDIQQASVGEHTFPQIAAWPTPLSDNLFPPEPCLTLDQELELLQNFFAYVHPCVPLIPRDKFLDNHASGVANRDLLTTVLVLTAKILGRPEFWPESNLNACLQHQLEAKNPVDSEKPSWRLSLDDFRRACMLAYYGYHQGPGEKAWMRIGNLCRKAHRYGLHLVDDHSRPPSRLFNCTSEDERDEWRNAWWCLYCLDSYSNITAAIPFIVETESIQTSLIKGRSPGKSQTKIFLPDNPSDLWKTTKEIFSQGEHVNYNMHIVTTYLVREAGTLYRLMFQNPSDRLRGRLVALENHVIAVRLALPPQHLNVGRNVLHGETCAAHHARLITIMHLHAARILLSIALQIHSPGVPRALPSDQALEYSQDVVSVVRHWDNQHSPSVDPAVCFIIYAALLVIHSHLSVVTEEQPEQTERLRMDKDMLLLFLEQFASFWYLPRLLLRSFDKVCQLSKMMLWPADEPSLLKHFQAPLHADWLALMAAEDSCGEAHGPLTIDTELTPQFWAEENWGQALGFP